MRSPSRGRHRKLGEINTRGNGGWVSGVKEMLQEAWLGTPQEDMEADPLYTLAGAHLVNKSKYIFSLPPISCRTRLSFAKIEHGKVVRDLGNAHAFHLLAAPAAARKKRNSNWLSRIIIWILCDPLLYWSSLILFLTLKLQKQNFTNVCGRLEMVTIIDRWPGVPSTFLIKILQYRWIRQLFYVPNPQFE